jgi:hypothetical protein
MIGLSGCVALESGIALPSTVTACGGVWPSNGFDEKAALHTIAAETAAKTVSEVAKDLVLMRRTFRAMKT